VFISRLQALVFSNFYCVSAVLSTVTDTVLTVCVCLSVTLWCHFNKNGSCGFNKWPSKDSAT